MVTKGPFGTAQRYNFVARSRENWPLGRNTTDVIAIVRHGPYSVPTFRIARIAARVHARTAKPSLAYPSYHSSIFYRWAYVPLYYSRRNFLHLHEARCNLHEDFAWVKASKRVRQPLLTVAETVRWPCHAAGLILRLCVNRSRQGKEKLPLIPNIKRF